MDNLAWKIIYETENGKKELYIHSRKVRKDETDPNVVWSGQTKIDIGYPVIKVVFVERR